MFDRNAYLTTYRQPSFERLLLQYVTGSPARKLNRHGDRGFLLVTFLSDLSFANGEHPPGRLELTAAAPEELLDVAAGGLRTVKQARRTITRTVQSIDPLPARCTRCPRRSPIRTSWPACASADRIDSAESSTSMSMPPDLHG
jgi:hypothetical protein